MITTIYAVFGFVIIVGLLSYLFYRGTKELYLFCRYRIDSRFFIDNDWVELLFFVAWVVVSLVALYYVMRYAPFTIDFTIKGV